jgi:hypothetical protein
LVQSERIQFRRQEAAACIGECSGGLQM